MLFRPGQKMRSFLRAAVVVLAFGVLAVSAAQPAIAAVVSRIAIEGNNRVDDETVRAYLTIRPGVSYGAAEVDESIAMLFATGLFEDVSITTRGNTLVVRVVENAVINRVSFEGNRRVTDEILEGTVESRFAPPSISRTTRAGGRASASSRPTAAAAYRGGGRGPRSSTVARQTSISILRNHRGRDHRGRPAITFIRAKRFVLRRAWLARRDPHERSRASFGFPAPPRHLYDPAVSRLQGDQRAPAPLLLQPVAFRRLRNSSRRSPTTGPSSALLLHHLSPVGLDGARYAFAVTCAVDHDPSVDPRTLAARRSSFAHRAHLTRPEAIVGNPSEELTHRANREGIPFAQVSRWASRTSRLTNEHRSTLLYRVGGGRPRPSSSASHRRQPRTR